MIAEPWHSSFKLVRIAEMKAGMWRLLGSETVSWYSRGLTWQTPKRSLSHSPKPLHVAVLMP
jgi:hypothetical protein